MGAKNRLLDNYGWVQDSSNLSTVRDAIDLVPEFGIKHLDLRHRIKVFRQQNGDLPDRWDWEARCRIKALHACGLIKLDRNIQGYEITQLGEKLRICQKSSECFKGFRLLSDEEIEVFRVGLLTNPPVIRVLELLNDERKTTNTGLTKYDIGLQLGFVGDRGFTHIDPEWVVANGYSFNDKEGDADKWARTILSWLVQVRWVIKAEEKANILGRCLTKYKALPIVDKILRYDARSIERNIPSEMLCSRHHPLKQLIQKRRVIIIHELSKRTCTLTSLINNLKENGIETDESVIKFEIVNLKQAGLHIVSDGTYYKLDDKIILDSNPLLFSPNTGVEEETSIERLIEESVVKYESTIPVRLVDNLIRYGLDSEAGRQFEATVAQYFRFLGYKTTYLGQGRGRVADVLARYIDSIYAKSYALIIDAKATASKYSFGASDVRKMKEYIQTHGEKLMEEKIPNHAFAFVSSNFVDNVKPPLEEIYNDSGIKGTAIKVLTLLELGDNIIQGKFDISKLYNNYTNNDIFELPN